MNASSWLTAVHESGHAVAALSLMGSFRRVSVVPAHQTLGRIHLGAASGYHAAVMALAGPTAARLAGAHYPFVAGTGDIAAAVGAMLTEGDALLADNVRSLLLAITPIMGQAEKRANELVGCYWTELTRAAAVLHERGELTVSEFAAAAGGELAGMAPRLEGVRHAGATAAAELTDVYVCHECDVRLVLPTAAISHMSDATQTEWARAQAEILGCSHSKEFQ